jgi:cation transport ATPase
MPARTEYRSITFARAACLLAPQTGTLTTGKPVVTDVIVLGGAAAMPEADFLFLVGSAELGSEHPLGRAIVEHARQVAGGRKLEDPAQCEIVPGRGLQAMVGAREVLVGNRAFFAEVRPSAGSMTAALDAPMQQKVEALEQVPTT